MIFVCKIRIISKIKISLLSWVPNLNIFRPGWLGPNFKFCSKNYHQHCHETTYKLIKRNCTLNIYRKLHYSQLFRITPFESLGSFIAFTHGLNQADATPQLEATIQRKRRHAISDAEWRMIRRRALSRKAAANRRMVWTRDRQALNWHKTLNQRKYLRYRQTKPLICLRDFVGMNFNRRME